MTPETGLFSMIISCPSCESRFKIDPDRIPAEGRQVRCGKCAHIWRIAADGSSMPIAAEDPSVPESVDVGNPSEGAFGRSSPATDNMPAGEDVSAVAGNPRDDDGPEQPGDRVVASSSDHAAGALLQDDENGAQEAGEANQANPAEAAADGEENAANPAPPLLGSTITPNARQKLAEARKGRSRVRFLVIALALMIVAVVAVSFIKGSDGLNKALRNVPGLDQDSAGDGIIDETPVVGGGD